jgi:hypothetical protein
MGGSEHSPNAFAHKNNDMNANDQSKQGPETEIPATATSSQRAPRELPESS